MTNNIPAPLPWFERRFAFGFQPELLPFFLERLAGTTVRLQAKLKNIPDTLLRWQPNGNWSIKQHIGHLAEVDQIALKRIDEMVQGVTPMSPAVFEPRGDYREQPLNTVLDFFTSTRLTNVERYKSLSIDDLKKASLHPRLKVLMTPVDLAWFDAEHDDHHLVMINQILTMNNTE